MIYCWNCGAPQILIADELAQQSEQQRRAMEMGLAASELHNDSTTDKIVWSGAIHCAALTGAVAAGLTLLSLIFPPLTLLAWLWAVGAPVIALGMYSSRFRQTRVRPGFGARLGLLCGVAVFACMTIVNTAGLLIVRFAFHAAAQLDAQLATFFAQVQTAIHTQGGPAEAPALAWLNVPENRLGLLFAMFAMGLVVYLGISAAGGAFAALLRSRTDPR